MAIEAHKSERGDESENEHEGENASGSEVEVDRMGSFGCEGAQDNLTRLGRGGLDNSVAIEAHESERGDENENEHKGETASGSEDEVDRVGSFACNGAQDNPTRLGRGGLEKTLVIEAHKSERGDENENEHKGTMRARGRAGEPDEA